MPLVLLVHVQPRLPALSQACLHHALRGHLLQVRNALLRLRLKRLRQRLGVLLRLTQNLHPRPFRKRMQLFVFRSKQCRHLIAKCVNLSLLLDGTSIGLSPHQPLALLQNSLLRCLPVGPPVRQRRRQRWLHQPARRTGQHSLVPLLLQPAAQPRLPALGELLLAHAHCCHLLRVRDSLLLLRLERLSQGPRALLLLAQELTAAPLRQLLKLELLLSQRHRHLRS